MNAPEASELREQRDRLRRRLVAAAAAGAERIGEWPLPIVIAHLARWDRVAAVELKTHFRGRHTNDYSDYEAWNRRWAGEDAGVSLRDALESWDRAFGDLVELVDGTESGTWDAEARAWLDGCTRDHHADHLRAADDAELPAAGD